MNPRRPLAELAAELRDDTTRLGALDNADRTASLPAVLSWSLGALTDDQIHVFSLLGIAPGSDISLPAAASLTALPEDLTRSVLRELENASLIQQHGSGAYRMHDLIRDYATDTARQQLAGDVQSSALRRVLDFYVHTAHTADRLLDPYRPPIRLGSPTPGVRPQSLPDVPAVMAWFDIEHATLLAAQRAAVDHAWHELVWQLAWTLNAYHNRRGYHRDRRSMWQAALFAADHLPDATARIHAHRLLGHTLAELGRHEEGIGHLNQALALAQEHQDPLQQANTHRRLALAWGTWGNDRRALEHATNARDLFRALDQPVLEALALNQVGLCAARLGHNDIAHEHCQAALALHRCHHYPVGEAVTLDTLGYISHQSGHRQKAVSYYQQAHAVFRALDNTYATADTLHRLGHLHVALDEHEQARIVLREALRLYQEQSRQDDADVVQQQLSNLDHLRDTAQPNERSGFTG